MIFPDVALAVNVTAVLAGVLVASLRAPLFAALFTMAMVDGRTAPVIAVAIIVSALATAILSLRDAKKKEEAEPNKEEAELNGESET